MTTALAPTTCPPAARLSLADIPTPVRLELLARRADGFTVARALPFLGIGRSLRDEDGRPAHIESVHVEIDGDTPRLVMDVAYDAAARDQTVPYTTPSRLPPPAPLPRTREGTLLFHTPSVAPGEERVSTAPVEPYRDTEELRDGLDTLARGVWLSARASFALTARGLKWLAALIGRGTLALYRALRRRALAGGYAGPSTPPAIAG